MAPPRDELVFGVCEADGSVGEGFADYFQRAERRGRVSVKVFLVGMEERMRGIEIVHEHLSHVTSYSIEESTVSFFSFYREIRGLGTHGFDGVSDDAA